MGGIGGGCVSPPVCPASVAVGGCSRLVPSVAGGMGGLSAGEDGAGGGCTVEGASGISCGAWDCAGFELWLFVDWPDCDWPDLASPVDTIRTSNTIRTGPTAASGVRRNPNHTSLFLRLSLLLRSTRHPLLKRSTPAVSLKKDTSQPSQSPPRPLRSL